MTLLIQINSGLASKYTSYVAVDPKEQKELKESWMVMKSRDIPVQVAHGWGGLRQNLVMTDSASHTAKPRVERCLLLGDGSSTESSDFMAFNEAQPVRDEHRLADTFETQPHSSLLSDDDKCILLISTQNYDGSFPMEHVLAQLLQTKMQIIKQGMVKLLCYRRNKFKSRVNFSGREMLLFRASLGDSYRSSIFIFSFA